jgi:hypothetical protein
MSVRYWLPETSDKPGERQVGRLAIRLCRKLIFVKYSPVMSEEKSEYRNPLRFGLLPKFGIVIAFSSHDETNEGSERLNTALHKAVISNFRTEKVEV